MDTREFAIGQCHQITAVAYDVIYAAVRERRAALTSLSARHYAQSMEGLLLRRAITAFANWKLAEKECSLASHQEAIEHRVEDGIPAAISSYWVLSQLAGVDLPGLGHAYDFMKRCLQKQSQFFKTLKQIQDLKDSWIDDPCWDIEETEGFEAHKQELYIFRLENDLKSEKRWSAELSKKLQDIKNALQ